MSRMDLSKNLQGRKTANLPFALKQVSWICLLQSSEGESQRPKCLNIASPGPCRHPPTSFFEEANLAQISTSFTSVLLLHILSFRGLSGLNSFQKVRSENKKMGSLGLSLVYILCTILTTVMLWRNLPLAWKLFTSPHWMVRITKHMHWSLCCLFLSFSC